MLLVKLHLTNTTWRRRDVSMHCMVAGIYIYLVLMLDPKWVLDQFSVTCWNDSCEKTDLCVGYLSPKILSDYNEFHFDLAVN